MPDKKYYVYVPGTTEPTVLSRGDYDAKKDKLFAKFADANVVEMQGYDRNEEIGDSDFFINIPGSSQPTQISAADFAAKKDKIYQAYPGVEVSRIRPVDYWGDKLRENYDRKNQLEEELKGIPETEVVPADPRAIQGGSVLGGETIMRERRESPNRLRRSQIQRELDELGKERENNPVYQKYRQQQISELDGDLARVDEMKGEAKKRVKSGDDFSLMDEEVLNVAKNFYEDAKKIASAPSKYGEDSGLSNYWKGVRDNAWDAISFVSLAKALGTIPLVEAVKQIQRNEGDDANILDLVNNHPEQLTYLSDPQKEMMRAFVKKAEVEASRDELSQGYKAGQSSIQSVGFMADFILTGGLGEAAANKVAGKLVQNTAKGSLGRLGAETLHGLVKAAVMSPLMPSTYSNILNNMAQFTDEGGVDTSGRAVLNAVGDAFIENVSETIGAKPLELLGWGAGKALPSDWLTKTKFGSWGKAMRHSPWFNAMKNAGWNGFVEEMFEEVSGNALRAWTGIDKDALSDFMKAENVLTTAAAFAPMTFVSGGISTAQYISASKKMREAGAELEKILASSVNGDELKSFLSSVQDMETPEELGKSLGTLYKSAVENGADGAVAMKVLQDYANAASTYKFLEGVYEEQKDIDRAQRAMELETKFGDNWSHEKDGERFVRTITGPNGETYYVKSEDEQGFSVMGDNGLSFIDKSQIESGEYIDSGETPYNEFLDESLQQQKEAVENTRIDQERQDAYNELLQTAQPGTEVNLGTIENPVTGVIQGMQAGRYIVASETGVNDYSKEEMANILGISLTPKTDDEIQEEEVKKLEDTEKAIRAVNTSSINLIGNQLGIPEDAAIQRLIKMDDGTLRLYYIAGGEAMFKDLSEPDLAELEGRVQESAPEPETKIVDDGTPRDFRGNPLPMRTNKQTGQQVVDGNALWNKDPEAWAKWNDTNPNQKVGSKERLEYTITELDKEIEKDSKVIQKAALKGIEEDEMDKMDSALQEKIKRRDTLISVLNDYNLPVAAGTTAAGEQRKAKAEKVKAEQKAGFPGIQQKWDESPKIVGAADEIRLPNGEIVTGNYVLTESDAPTASHNPSEGFKRTEGFPVDENGKTVNDRDYEHDKAAQKSVIDKAGNYDQRALQTPVIVSADGVVLSGNDRTMASQLAASNNTDKAYTDYLGKYSQKYGFSKEQVGQFEHPRVVFVPDTEMAYNAANFAKFNAEEKKSQSKTEKAVKAGKTLTPQTLGQLATLVDRFDDINALYNDPNGVDELLNILLVGEVITQEQLSSLKDGNTLSGTGMDLLESTLIGAALDEEAVRVAMQDKSIRKAVVSAISQIITGNTLEGYTLRTELSDAINLVSNGKKEGLIKTGDSVQGYIRQGNLFGGDVVAEATVQMLADAINSRKTSFLKNVLSLYNRDAVEAANGQMSILTNDVPTRDLILREILSYLGYDTAIIFQPAAEAAATESAESETGETGPVVQSDAESQVISDRDQVAAILEENGESLLAEYMTDEEAAEFMRLYNEFQPANDALGQAYTDLKDELESKDEETKQAAQAKINELEAAQVAAFQPVQDYARSLMEQYGLNEENPEDEFDDEFEEFDDFEEEEKPKKKSKKSKKAKESKEPELPKLTDFGGADVKTINKTRYSEKEMDEFVWGSTFGTTFYNEELKILLYLYGNGEHFGGNEPVSTFRVERDGKYVGQYSESNSFWVKYIKANKFVKDEESAAKKNKYGFWEKPDGVILNRIEIRVPSVKKGHVSGAKIELGRHRNGKWEVSGWASYSIGGSSLNHGLFDKKSDAIRSGIESLTAFHERYQEDHWTSKDVENLIRTLKTKTLPQALLEEGAVESYPRTEITAAELDNGVQGLLFGEEEPVGTIVEEKPKRKTAAKKEKKAKKETSAPIQGEYFAAKEQITDEEGTPGNYNWTSERVCTNPTVIVTPSVRKTEGYRTGEVNKIALAERDGKWYWSFCVVPDGDNRGTWGESTPYFHDKRGEDSREAAIETALSKIRFALETETSHNNFGRTFNEAKELIDYIVTKELPKKVSETGETTEDALRAIGNALRNFQSNGNYARVAHTIEAYQDFFGDEVAEEIDTILKDLRGKGISKESKDEMVRRVAELYNRLASNGEELQEPETAEEAPAETPAYGSQNTIITTDKYEELKAKMKEKLGQLNAGFDPEVFFIGAQMAAYHVEAGARKFVDFSKRMINDLGDAIRPYLKAIYNGARDLPGMEAFKKEMDSAAVVEDIDVDSIGVEQPEEAQAPVEETEPEERPEPVVKQVDVNALFGAVNDLARGKREEVKLSDYATDIQDARENTDTNPSDAQKEAGNYKKGHISIDGYDISLENPKGSVRSGKDASGKEWSVTMNNDYGYIRMTEGVDGDHIDVFLSDNPTEGNVFVVDQVNDDGSFDEHKVMYGFASADEASKAYLANYSPGWKGLGNITEVSKDEFKKWVDSSHRKTKPFAEYKSVNPIAEEKAAEEETPEANTLGEIGKYTHTKTGKEMTIVRLTGERVSADEFKQLKARAKKFGGYYSSYGSSKGFLFDNEEDAIKFNTIEQNERTDKQTAADTAAIVSEAASVAIEAQSLAEAESADEGKAAEVITRIDEALEAIDDQLALLGYYEADESEPFHEMYGYMKSAEKKAVKDADKLAKRLAKDLGIEVGRKKIARANIAPAGGDITFTLPLNEGRELYVDISLEPDETDSLGLGGVMGRNMAIMYRVENRAETGLDRYGRNNFAPYNVSYSDLLRGIRSVAADYIPAAPAAAEPSDIMQVIKEQAEKSRKSDKKSVPSQKNGDELLGGLFNDLYTEEEPTEELAEELPVSRVVPTEVNGYKKGDKVLYIRDGKAVEATIYDFEYDGRPVLDAGLAPVLYEVTDWENIKPLENGLQRDDEPSAEGTPTDNSGQQSGLPENEESAGQEAWQEGERADRNGDAGSEGDLHGSKRSNRPRYDDSVKRNTHNNRVSKGEVIYPKSPDARFKANLAAVKLMKELQESGKQATKEQMSVLRQFTGWGGLGGYFNNEYSFDYRELKSVLNDEEMQAAALSINTAYYTPVEVIDAMWEVAKRLGFEGGNVLEGSAGIGNILASMPKGISEHSEITAVELDSITGGILELLYPDAKVMVKGFQDADIPNGSVDLAITNVPFGDIQVYDSKEKDITRKFGGKIHDFCIAKNVRKLSEGGIGIFISTRGTLDNSSKALRQWIVNEGGCDVIGAFRLNNATFEGTKATSDIIVVRKRVSGRPSPNAINVTDTEITRREEYELDKTEWNPKTRAYEFVKGTAAMEVNNYFVEHPENMGGVMGFGFEHNDTYRPASAALWPTEKIDQNKRLDKWAKHFTEEEKAAVKEEANEVEESSATKEGQLVTNSKGEICISRQGKAVPLGLNSNKVKGRTKAQVLADYDALKAAINEALAYQLKNESDEGLKPLLAKLNRAYDNFKTRYDRLNKNTAISFLRNDVDFPAIAAVEDYKETKSMDGKVKISVKKTSIFEGRVLGAKRVPSPKDAKDGVIVSINQFGRIDIPFIAEALKKDEEEVKQEIINTGLGFENPATGEVEVEYEYLSGDVREKLDYAKEHNTDGKYDKNIEALEKAVPADIPAHLIEFSLGSDWLPDELYKQFAMERFGLNDSFRLNLLGGVWSCSDREWEYGGNNEKNRSAGVRSEKLRMDAKGHELMVAAMNNKPIVFSKTYKDSVTGENVTERDPEATQAATTKMAEMRDDFKEWARAKMLAEPELSERIAKTYNDIFNAIVPKEIKDTFIPEHFEGMATKLNSGKPLNLRVHQAKAVIRATTEPLMMAHEVGSGKTFTLITTAMEMRRLGTAKKPMIVVQNATLGQFVSSAKELYPNAKVLTISESDRTVEGRSAFYAKIKYNDWDIIIVPQSVFEMMPDSEERQRAFVQERIDEKKFIIAQAKEAGDNNAVRNLEKELKDLEYEYEFGEKPKKKKDAKNEAKAVESATAKAKKQLDRKTDDVSDFDDMGIDALLVDEAHSYKHLGFTTSMQRGVKGVDPSGSKKSAGVYLKTRSVFDKVGWKNVVFATGTPISNTAAEIWTFMKYLMPADVMRQNHIYYFDDFVRNFGNISQSLEFTTSGKFKENTRFASYTNLPELIRIWSSVCDTVLSKDAIAEGEKLEDKQPKMEDWTDSKGVEHKNQAKDIYLPQSPALVDIMTAIRARLEWYEGLTGKEKKEHSYIPLTMFGLAKMAAIDPRLVDKNAPDEPMSKTNKAVEETLQALKDSAKYKGTCALFCDNFRRWDLNENGKRVEGFNIFEEIKRKLVAAGVPEDQIVIMKSGMSTAAKEKTFARVNAGEVRVIMGTTATLGTGVNIQERLFFASHIDAPNRPMDYTQRNGRILRQGNLHKEWNVPVRVVRFGVEDSLDVTAYQRLSTKAKFINSVMDGKPLIENGMNNRVLEEEEEGEFDNPVAVLSGSEYAMLKSAAERELRKLRNKKEQHRQDQIYIERTLKENANRIDWDKTLIEKAKKNLDKARSSFPEGKPKEILIEGHKYSPEYLKERILTPLRDKIEKKRNDYNFTSEAYHYTLTFDGIPVDVKVTAMRSSEWDERTSGHKIVMRTLLNYSCPTFGVEDRIVPGGYAAIKDIIPDFSERLASGKYFEDAIKNLENTISRLESDDELMLQRRGKPFADEDKLKKQEEIVKDYTEKMKEEMAAKEAKYAEMVKNAKTTFNVDSVELDDEEEEEEEEHDSIVTNEAKKLDVNDPLVLTEAISAVNRLARKLNLEVKFDDTLEAKGAYSEKNGIRINLANCESIDDAVETLLHEGVAHFGLRQLLGRDGMSEFVDDLLKNATNNIKRRIEAIAQEQGVDMEYAAEEYVAELAEKTDYTKSERSLWRRILDFFRNVIDTITGRQNYITDDTIRELLKASYKNLEEGSDSDNFDGFEDEVEHYRIRTKPAPEKTGIGYKVFFKKGDNLYPPMVNPTGEATPVGVWLDAEAAPVVETSKTGRPKVKAGGKGTQGGSGSTLAYRPGWHLGEIPYAIQFNRLNPETGKKDLFPKDFVWAEVEYAADKDYQKEAEAEGITENGKFQHSLAGLKKVPEDGFYRYRTNPNPETDPWIITGAMKVNRVLSDEEVDEIVREAGREPQTREGGKDARRSIWERYENQDGDKYPWMNEADVIEAIEREVPHGVDTEHLFVLVDKYKRLKEEDFDEGRRDFSGGEAEDVFEEILDELQSDARNRPAFHGSGADFDAFDLGHMGEGEGAQAHGWGHYVALTEGTARGYANRLANSNNIAKINEMYDERNRLEVEKERMIEEYKEKNNIYEKANAAEHEMNVLLGKVMDAHDEYHELIDPIDRRRMAGEITQEEFNTLHDEALKSAKHYNKLEELNKAYEEANHKYVRELSKANEKILVEVKRSPEYQRLDDEQRRLEILVDIYQSPAKPKNIPEDASAEELIAIARAADRLSDGGGFRSADELRKEDSYEYASDYEKAGVEYVGKTAPGDWDFSRNLYSVEIPDDNGSNYLDEEAVVSTDVFNRVVDGLKERRKTDKHIDSILPNDLTVQEMKLHMNDTLFSHRRGVLGDDLYGYLSNLFGSHKKASLFLSSLGFVGIKYDGMQDGPCAVIFKDEDVKIVEHQRFRAGYLTDALRAGYEQSLANMREKVTETAEKCGIEIKFRPSKEMKYDGKPLAGRWINGKMYVCLEHCRDNDDAIRTVLHEGVGHNGLRKLVGDENMDKFCIQVFNRLPKEVREHIAGEAISKYNLNIAEAVEEYLAEQAEVVEYKRTLWDIVRDALRNLLAKLGIVVNLNDNDVRWILWQSYNANKQSDLLNEAKRQVVAKRLGFTLRQQAEKGRAIEIVRNREAGNALSAARIYNKDVMNWMSRLHETWVDKDDAVNRLVNAIEKSSGKKAKAFEDIRLSLNQQSSKGLAAIEKFDREHYDKMTAEVKAIMDKTGKSLKEVERYVMIKHALERNEVFAKRDALNFYRDEHDTNVSIIKNSDKIDDLTKEQLIAKEDAKFEKHKRAIEAGTDVKYRENRNQDYGGLTAMFSEYDPIEPFNQGVESNEEYQARVLQARHPKYTYIDSDGVERVDMPATEKAAEDEVKEFESLVDVTNLWKEINGATKFTLKHQYDANMLSREQYSQVRDMFKYYVPLRGFAENTAEDMYDYYNSDQRKDFTPPLLIAKGRKSEAESPFGYIGSMASSAIAADMKNETKLALYYFVSNRPDNDLVGMSEVWFKNTGIDDVTGKRIFTPVYPPFKEDLNKEEAKKAYEEWEKGMEEEAKAGFAFKGRRKLNLHNSVIHIDDSQQTSHVIKFKVGGREMMMYINGNPRAAQAINNELNVEMSTDYQKVFGKVLRWFSGINTSYNPEFWLSNAQRDALFALMSVDTKENPQYGKDFRRNFGKILRNTLTPGAKNGAYSLKKRLDSGNLGEGLDELYKEFVENGGVTGYTTLKNNEEWELEIRNHTGKDRVMLGAVKSLFEKIQGFGEAIEQMTRFAAYVTSRQNGKEIKDAVNDAKDLTVNFNRKGSGKAISFKEADRLRTSDGKPLTLAQKAFVVGASWLPVYGRRFIIFFNASVQGLNAMYKLYKKNPARLGTWAAGYLMLGVMNAVLHSLMDDDDDYLDIPDYERRNNLLVGGDGVYFKWALPQESRVFYAVGDMAVNHILGREPHKGMAGEVISAVSDIAPLNPAGGVSALAPSALAPVVEVVVNRDYKGSKIYNDLKYLSDEERKRTPAYKQAYQGTGKLYTLASEGLNWLTGGDYADAGWININPAVVEHLLQGATGGAGTTIGKMYRGTVGQVFGEEFAVRNTPFLSRLLTITDDRYRNAHTTELFDFYKAEAEHTKKLVRQYSKNGDEKKLEKILDSEDYEIMLIYESYRGMMEYYNEELKVTEDKKERKELMREQDALRKEMINEISELK